MATGPQAGGTTENRAATAGRKSFAVALLAGVLVVALGLAAASFFLFRDVNVIAGLPGLARIISAITQSAPPAGQAVRPGGASDSGPGAAGPGGAGNKSRGNPAAWKRNLEAGLAAYRNKQPEEAERLYAEALAGAVRFGSHDPRVGLVLSRSGSLYWSMRKLDRAEWYLRRAAEIIDALTQQEIVAQLGGEEVFLAERTQRTLGVVYRDQGKDADAARHFEQAADAARALTGVREITQGATIASDLYDLAMAQCKLGRLEEARESLKQAGRANPKVPSAAHRFKAIASLDDNMAQGRPCWR